MCVGFPQTRASRRQCGGYRSEKKIIHLSRQGGRRRIWILKRKRYDQRQKDRLKQEREGKDDEGGEMGDGRGDLTFWGHTTASFVG